jgi:hypothetical protein
MMEENSLEIQMKKDLEKEEACRIAGIRLLQVPYYWRYDPNSLLQAIKQVTNV